MEGGLLLDIVVSKGSAILQLLASEDQSLLVRGDALLVLDLGLHVVDGVRGLHLQRDGLPRQGLHEDLHLLLASSSLALRVRRLEGAELQLREN